MSHDHRIYPQNGIFSGTQYMIDFNSWICPVLILTFLSQWVSVKKLLETRVAVLKICGVFLEEFQFASN